MIKGTALAIVATLVVAALPAQAGVTVLQNGVSPAADYAGCRDTWISGEQWEGGNQGKAATLTAGGKRAVLIQFDLAAIPKDQLIHKAVLRLAEAAMPRPAKEGKHASLMAYRLTHDWTESAGWKQFDRPPVAKGQPAPDTNWTAVGGDFDSQSDFGQSEKGLIAADAMLVGAFGHMRELDVTPIVKAWLEGKYPNQGLLIQGSGAATLAGAEWHVPAYRPALLVDHGPKGSRPAGIPPLVGRTPEQIDLDPVSATPEAGAAKGDYATVRVGQNETAALRGKSTDAYVKEAVLKFPGNWGWALQCRVGGVAGDFSRTLLWFDLSELPRGASIQSARLRVFYYQPGRETAGVRFGAYQVRLPEAPGWVDAEVTFAEARQGAAWPKGGLLAATSDKPAALATSLVDKVESPGRAGKAAVGLEFDLTGLVRAWTSGKAPNCGVLLDNRIEGGYYDIHSSRSWQFDKRPYLEITLSPGVARRPAPITDQPAAPAGDYWVAAMREVHQRFKGTPGTLSQYGDSIRITGAYLQNFAWGKKITELANVDRWQKVMNAEAATIMFGTNDLGGLNPPQYCDNLAGSCLRMMQDGTIPMLNSVPPAAGREQQAHEAWLQVCSDGTHPSNPARFVNDFSEEALSHNGYTLRNYTTLRMYYQLLSKVFQPGG